jgi:hypothetical protein
MKVYHGSYTEIDKIEYKKCRLYRDFGRGFYVTKYCSQAETWASRKGVRFDSNGFVTEFEFSESAFENWEFKVKRFDEYTEEWLDFIVANRNVNLPQPTHDFDIVEGPVADDDVTQRITDYLKGEVSKQDFLNELKFRKPSHQICFCTRKSLQAISKNEKYDFAYSLKNITRQIIKKLVTEKGLDKMIATDKFYDSDTFTKLADKTTLFYEKDWNEIYKLLLNELNI